jgi:hypothetical protein
MENYKYRLLIAVTVGAMSVACSQSNSKSVAAATDDTEITTEYSGSGLELPLPKVPKDITDPQKRAAYVMQHFWDSLDFADTTKSLNKDIIEQNFSNFITLFPVASEAAQHSAVSQLLKHAAANTDAYNLMLSTANKYLYEPDSPMFNEDFYAIFIECVLSDKIVDQAERQRMTTRQKWIAKNRPGTTATNFKYRTASGKTTTLLQTPVSGEMLMILYDPTCDHCREILKSIADNAGINQSIADGTLTVLAINLVPNEKPYPAPEHWINGTDLSSIEDNDLYIIRATPTLFVLDAAHNVIAKDVQPSAILR